MSRQPHGVCFENIEFGKNIIVKEGKDITLIASGPQLKNILLLAEILQKEGIESQVIYCHTIKPFDKDSLIESALQTKNVFAVEEHISSGSLISRVLETCASYKDIAVAYHAIGDNFIRNYVTYDDIANHLGFKPEIFRSEIKQFLKI